MPQKESSKRYETATRLPSNELVQLSTEAKQLLTAFYTQYRNELQCLITPSQMFDIVKIAEKNASDAIVSKEDMERAIQVYKKSGKLRKYMYGYTMEIPTECNECRVLFDLKDDLQEGDEERPVNDVVLLRAGGERAPLCSGCR